MAPYFFWPLFAGFLIAYRLTELAVTALLHKAAERRARARARDNRESWNWPFAPTWVDWDRETQEQAGLFNRPSGTGPQAPPQRKRRFGARTR